MKKRLFIYLFIFAALIALFQFVNASKMLKGKEDKITRLRAKVVKLEDSEQEAKIEVAEMRYFLLESNDDALSYYDHLNIKDLAGYIADKLIETNETKGDNPLIPYAGMEGVFKINKIKVLNHKWIITDFSDGKYWGELFIKYELKDDLGVDFTLVDHLLYQKD